MNGYIQDVWIFVLCCKLWDILRLFLRITVNLCHIQISFWGYFSVDGLDLAFPLERIGKYKWNEIKQVSSWILKGVMSL